MTAPFSLRQMPVAAKFSFLLDQAEGIAAALQDNAGDNPGIDEIDPIVAANWHAQVLRIARIINPANK